MIFHPSVIEVVGIYVVAGGLMVAVGAVLGMLTGRIIVRVQKTKSKPIRDGVLGAAGFLVSFFANTFITSWHHTFIPWIVAFFVATLLPILDNRISE